MQQGRHRTSAVVVNRVLYGEADLIVAFVTREFGHVRGLAKHARKSRKRFGNVFASPGLVELAFSHKAGRDLVSLEEGEVIRCFDGISRDAQVLGFSGLALELVDAFFAPLDPMPEAFDLLVWCLDRLDRGVRPAETMFVFHLRLLGLAGFAPQVAACTACGCPVDAEKSWELKPERGGLACADCGGGGFQVRAGSLKLMGLIQTLPLDKLDRVRVSDQAMAEAGPFLMALTRHTLGRELKSSRFLEQIGRRPPSA